MRPHFFQVIPNSPHQHRQQVHDLLYTAIFLVGAPAVVMSSMYLVEAVFNLLWR